LFRHFDNLLQVGLVFAEAPFERGVRRRRRIPEKDSDQQQNEEKNTADDCDQNSSYAAKHEATLVSRAFNLL
jgi:hypothetical protein